MYKIEPHLHTTHVSRCGRLEAKEIVAGYKAAGYSALIVTDHFNRTTFEHLGIDPAGKSDRIGAFLEGYRRVREECERQGLRVFKGAELRFDECENDYLLYGWANELLAEPEEIFRMGIAAFSPIARGQGALLIQAHPYRHGCTPAIARYLDGSSATKRTLSSSRISPSLRPRMASRAAGPHTSSIHFTSRPSS